jgi:hypothetical protein
MPTQILGHSRLRTTQRPEPDLSDYDRLLDEGGRP